MPIKVGNIQSITSSAVDYNAPELILIRKIIKDRKENGKSYKEIPEKQKNRLFKMMLDSEKKETNKRHDMKILPKGRIPILWVMKQSL